MLLIKKIPTNKQNRNKTNKRTDTTTRHKQQNRNNSFATFYIYLLNNTYYRWPDLLMRVLFCWRAEVRTYWQCKQNLMYAHTIKRYKNCKLDNQMNRRSFEHVHWKLKTNRRVKLRTHERRDSDATVQIHWQFSLVWKPVSQCKRFK